MFTAVHPYTPYYILYSILSIFGHDARLPVDNILSFPGDQSNSPDEWVQLHHYQMQEAVKRANNRIKLKAAERKNRHVKSAVSSALEIGSKVLLRNHVKGRNKIQDTWNPTSYIVVGRIAENNTA